MEEPRWLENRTKQSRGRSTRNPLGRSSTVTVAVPLGRGKEEATLVSLAHSTEDIQITMDIIGQVLSQL
jgi:hypothetical protein